MQRTIVLIGDELYSLDDVTRTDASRNVATSYCVRKTLLLICLYI